MEASTNMYILYILEVVAKEKNVFVLKISCLNHFSAKSILKCKSYLCEVL